MTRRHLTLAIEGLSCGGGGALAVERALAHVSGIDRVYVNPLTEMAYIDCDADSPDEEVLVRAVERAGFRAGALRAR